jgi:hypothetical protein
MRKQRGRKEKGGFMNYEYIFRKVEHAYKRLLSQVSVGEPISKFAESILDSYIFNVLQFCGVTSEWTVKQITEFADMEIKYRNAVMEILEK